MRTVELPLGARITIDNAPEVDLLKCHPPTVGWKWSGDGESSSVRRFFGRSRSHPTLKVLIINEKENVCEPLFSTRVDDNLYWHDIVFKWLPVVASLKEFSLVVTCECSCNSDPSSGTVILRIAPAFNSQDLVLELINGVGLEIGPGLNPQIRPRKNVHVRYIEAAGATEWVKLYKKSEKLETEAINTLRDRYTVSSADFLAGVDDNSLNFIFSNHVFEHLMNPLGYWRTGAANSPRRD